MRRVGTQDGRRRRPRPQSAIVAVAGSAGAVIALRDILGCLPKDFPAPILYAHHLNASSESFLADVLQGATGLAVRWARQGERPKPGVVHLSPPGSVLSVQPDGTLAVTPTSSPREMLRAADRLFISAAARHGAGTVGVVLSGGGSDGSEGVCAIHETGGIVLVQDEVSAMQWSMPRASFATGSVDLVLSPRSIAPALVNLVRDGHPVALVRSNARSLKRASVPVHATVSTALGAVLARVVALRGADMGNVRLVEPATSQLAIIAQRGFGLDFLERLAAVGPEDGMACSRAMAVQQNVVIPDVAADPAFEPHRDIVVAAGFRTVQSVPLFTRQGTFVGVLSVHFRRPHCLKPGRAPTVDPHTRHAGDLIERLRDASLVTA